MRAEIERAMLAADCRKPSDEWRYVGHSVWAKGILSMGNAEERRDLRLGTFHWSCKVVTTPHSKSGKFQWHVDNGYQVLLTGPSMTLEEGQHKAELAEHGFRALVKELEAD